MTFYIDSRNIMKPRRFERNQINTLRLYKPMHRSRYSSEKPTKIIAVSFLMIFLCAGYLALNYEASLPPLDSNLSEDAVALVMAVRRSNHSSNVQTDKKDRPPFFSELWIRIN